MHMVAARFGCERAMVGTGWATSRPGCVDRLTKHYSRLVGGKEGCLGRISGKEGCLGLEWVCDNREC